MTYDSDFHFAKTLIKLQDLYQECEEIAVDTVSQGYKDKF